MKKNKTHITLILDESGSMHKILNSTIDGFNEFLLSQQKIPGECSMFFYKFNNKIKEEKYDNIKDIKKLSELNYSPDSTTALLDAIGKGIIETGKYLKDLNENERAEKVIFVIITDGQENSSVEFKIENINSMIDEQKNKWNWEFIFIGANQDAISTASKFGIGANNSLNYTANDIGTTVLYSTISRMSSDYRTGKINSMEFSEEDRIKQEESK